LPLQRGSGGPIVGGRHRQPTPGEVQERAMERPPGRAGDPSREATRTSPRDRDQEAQERYQRVLRNSERPTPRSIDPSQQ
jgi:hypothetical protein